MSDEFEEIVKGQGLGVMLEPVPVYELCPCCDSEGCVWCDELGLIEHACSGDLDVQH